jgi:CRP-like cAMP-binding protein
MRHSGHDEETGVARNRRNELVEHLGTVPLFSRCSKKELQAVGHETDARTFPQGTTIIRQGEAGDAFYVMLDGSAVVRRNGRKVGELRAGDYFGELALLDPAPRNADVVAASPSVSVAILNAGSFRSLIRAVPAMNERLLAGLSRRIRDADRKSVE